MFKFFLNGTEIANHPDGWDNISSTIKRDKFSGGLLYDADIKLMSYGGQDLYVALKTAWDTDRFGKSSFRGDFVNGDHACQRQRIAVEGSRAVAICA